MEEKILKILLVEDNPADVRLIKEYLKEANIPFQLTITDRVSDALIKMRKEHDVIIADLGLPDSSGINTLKVLKKSGTQVPIVILTGMKNEEFALISLKEGASDYLLKSGLDSQTISRSIKYSIQRKHKERKQALALEILQILNNETELSGLLKNILNTLKTYINTEAISIKIKEGKDFFHRMYTGFSNEFIAKEIILFNNIHFIDRANTNKFSTLKKSYWLNNTTEYLKKINSVDNDAEYIKLYVEAGFSTLVMIPMYAGDELTGLLYYAGKKPDCFSEDNIKFHEGMADNIALTIKRIMKK